MIGVRDASLRGRLTRNLVLLGLVSVLLLGGINYVASRALLHSSIDDQLSGLAEVRTQAVAAGFDRITNQVSSIARDPGVVQSLAELDAAYSAIEQPISAADTAALEESYVQDPLAAYVEAGVEHPTPAELLPGSTAGQYVQSQYVADNPFPPGERRDLDDAGDGSEYSAAHGRHHPFLRQLSEVEGASDLLFVSFDSNEVIYSVEKQIDLGTDVSSGYQVDTGLGEAVGELERVAVGQAVVADATFYLPAGGAPMVFIAAAVRDGPEVVGAVVVSLSTDVLTDLTTAGGRWGLLGLGDTGETYVVGSDLTLRSESRAWLEDPDRYLARLDADRTGDRNAGLIRLTGSTVLIQPVDNDAVSTALDGDIFVGRVTGYLGDETVAASRPVDAGGLDWVVVAEQAASETDSVLDEYLERVLIVLALLLPAIAVAATLLARTLVRPVAPLVDTARSIAAGDLDVEVPDLGTNELGDLARQLELTASRLRDQEQRLEHEEARIDGMLEAVLPRRLIDRVRRGEREIADVRDTVTVISMTFVGAPGDDEHEQEVWSEAASAVKDELDRLSAGHDVERVVLSSGHQMFLTGLASPEEEVADAIEFVFEAMDAVHAVGADFEVDIGVRIGLAAGEVATGLLGASQVSFGVWGDPPGVALSLAAMAEPGQVLVDGSVVDQLPESYRVHRLIDVIGLAGDETEAYSLRHDEG